MKTLLTAVTLITALGMMSFMTAPNSGILREGDFQYRVDQSSQLSEEDSQVVLSTVAEKYKLGDYRMIEGSLELEPIQARRGNWIIKRKLFLNWLDEQFITWEEVQSEPETVQMLDGIISKYAD
ncbi:MAG: hypothetical protein R2792_16400 [Saprospiraceae bacterium]|jgi:hypothetical protein